MTHYLSISIYADSLTPLESVQATIPSTDDSRVSDAVSEHDYISPVIASLEDGVFLFSASLHFKEDAGREEVFQAIQNIQDVFSNCLPESEILLVASYSHDGSENKPCEILARYKVVV